MSSFDMLHGNDGSTELQPDKTLAEVKILQTWLAEHAPPKGCTVPDCASCKRLASEYKGALTALETLERMTRTF